MLGQEREKEYLIQTFPFKGTYVWTIKRREENVLLANGSRATRKDAYQEGKSWLKRHERRQKKEVTE